MDPRHVSRFAGQAEELNALLDKCMAWVDTHRATAEEAEALVDLNEDAHDVGAGRVLAAYRKGNEDGYRSASEVWGANTSFGAAYGEG